MQITELTPKQGVSFFMHGVLRPYEKRRNKIVGKPWIHMEEYVVLFQQKLEKEA
ncbi:hypothetical protein SAMN05421852_10348 [Thermoflavimicrobium dichotomicum]|uniref:Uncharacterized protein n=1 Tax=Thermoflavimicrobium dichotomicum TaxID=46223 RepID=A0A1I3MG90_9BACL|nr:hypothetical protein SAMN05421852_10348 [Thermoflavimicrobium dichotomicum]